MSNLRPDFLSKRPRYVMVEIDEGRPSLTFHTYDRPCKGQRVEVLGGAFKGQYGTVTKDHSPWDSYTYAVKIAPEPECCCHCCCRCCR